VRAAGGYGVCAGSRTWQRCQSRAPAPCRPAHGRTPGCGPSEKATQTMPLLVHTLAGGAHRWKSGVGAYPSSSRYIGTRSRRSRHSTNKALRISVVCTPSSACSGGGSGGGGGTLTRVGEKRSRESMWPAATTLPLGAAAYHRRGQLPGGPPGSLNASRSSSGVRRQAGSQGGRHGSARRPLGSFSSTAALRRPSTAPLQQRFRAKKLGRKKLILRKRWSTDAALVPAGA